MASLRLRIGPSRGLPCTDAARRAPARGGGCGRAVLPCPHAVLVSNSMREQVPGTPLVAEGEWESEWTVSAPSLEELKQLLGMPLLVEFCGCGLAADRIVSLTDFGYFNDAWTPRLEIAHSRNLQTMFWLVCGTLHEAIDSLREMEELGIEGLLGSLDARKPWLELRSLARRWEDDPIFQRVRNKIAFHLDAAAITRGINKTGRAAEPVVWKKGNTGKERSSTFAFAQDCLLSLLLPGDLADERQRKRFREFAERVHEAHLGFSDWVQELFVAAVRGASIGLKPTPSTRPKAEGLSQARLDEIDELAGQAMDETHKQAFGDLLREVIRLSNLVRRMQNDPNLANAKRRRSDEEQRLRAIAATAKQFLESRAPAAEQRLRVLLQEAPME